MSAQPKLQELIMLVSNIRGSSDLTQIICDDDPIVKPFIGSGLGRAKAPDHVSGGHSLMWF
jgi:hypothetical protein